MNNKFMNALKEENTFAYTENGAIKRTTTLNAVYDMFAFGGAYRSRSDADVILLFKKAFEEDRTYALKCLFYLRDCRGGIGERRFFRLCAKWLAENYPSVMRRNLQYVPEFGRYDDWYVFVDTPLENDMFALMRKQLALDVQCKTPSLLAKWLKSENTSSAESRRLGNKTREYLKMSHKQYRKTLSILRQRINVLERLMSANEWDKIEFDKIPSKAGLVYKNAFARRDIIKAKFEAFAKSKDTKVNAKTLFPYEVVRQAIRCRDSLNGTDRAMINKYWDNLENVFNNEYSFNAMAIVDTSGSMQGGWNSNDIAPIDIAISLGLYCAEKANGPFHGHYISFASRPQLISTEGVDFVDKVKRIYRTNLCDNTNLEAAFDLVLNTAVKHNMKQEDLPQSLIIISDMEIDQARNGYWYHDSRDVKTTMSAIRDKWTRAGYKCPNLVYWNVDARNDTILDDGPNVTYVSGASSAIFTQIMTGKTGINLMFDKLDSEKYKNIG